jgi:hypothetical protein
MSNRVFGDELELPGHGHSLHDAEGRCLARGGLEELKSFLACDGPDHAHPHLPPGKYRLSGPGVDEFYYKQEGRCLLGGDECLVRTAVLEIGENPGPCNGAPVHRVRIFDGRLGAVVTRYVCPGHCGVMDEVYQRMNGGPDRSATQDN